jgi:putative sigma-54 modulation protein
MKFDIKGVHYDLTDVTREFLESKLVKLEFAADHILDLNFILSKGKGTNDWKAEVKVSFKWGHATYLEETAFNLHEAIDKLIDKLEHKVVKEKEKIQDHHHGEKPVLDLDKAAEV